LGRRLVAEEAERLEAEVLAAKEASGDFGAGEPMVEEQDHPKSIRCSKE